MSRTSIAPPKGREVMQLTEAGIQAMWNEVDSAVEDGRTIDPNAILDVPENIEPFLSGKCKFQTISHGGLTKRGIAERVYKIFEDSGETVQAHLSNKGLWCWLMLVIGPSYHFTENNLATGTNHEKFVPHVDGYRHHIAFLAWAQETISTHGVGRILLTGNKNKFGDAQEQTIQGHIMRSISALKLLDELTYNPKEDYWKKLGKAVPEDRRNTKAFRYIKAWLYKIDALYDVYSMSYEDLLELARDSGLFEGETDIGGVKKKWTMFTTPAATP